MDKLCKKLTAVVLSLAMAVSGLVITTHQSGDVKAAVGEWKMVWSDEFEGNSLNRDYWNVEVNDSGGGNNEHQYYLDSTKNINVSNGTLKINALKERYSNKDYTSGRINTKGKKSFKYGKVEARMKLPSFTGAWPAFWMLGSNYDSVGWPKCGELDIMEAINTQNFTHGHVHWYTSSADYTGHADYGKSSEGAVPSNFDRTQWHTYSIEWDKSAIKWYVDNTQFNEIDISGSDLDEFQKAEFIIFNLAIGGDWPGHDIDNTAFPSKSTMEVDYVRVYQKEEPQTTKYNGPTVTVKHDAVAEYTGTWTSFFGSSINWVPANGTLKVESTPAAGFTMNLSSVGNIQNDSVWGAQANLEKIKYHPGNTYTYSCTITSDKDKVIFVKVADQDEEVMAGGLIQLKAGVPYNYQTDVEIPDDFNGTVSLKFGMGKTNGDTVADNSAVTINVKNLSFVSNATMPDPSYVPQTTTKTSTTAGQMEQTSETGIKLAQTKVRRATKKKASKKVKLTLKRIKGATGYKVQFSKTKKFKKILATKYVKKIKVTIKRRKLRNKKKLYVRAKAYKKIGNRKYYSTKWSKVKRVRIKK